MNTQCANCQFANKSGNPDFVFCTYWQDKANESKMSQEDFVRNVLFPQTELNQVALGFQNSITNWKRTGCTREPLQRV